MLSPSDIDHLATGTSSLPHKILGLHQEGGRFVLRFFLPGARACPFKYRGELIEATCIDRRGLFEWVSNEPIEAKDYQVLFPSHAFHHDPYAFLPPFPEDAARRMVRGEEDELANFFGARPIVHEGVVGTYFSVWAPNAKACSLVGDFNRWHEFAHPMRYVAPYGIWDLFVPGVGHGELYKFSVVDSSGKRLLRSDPLGRWFEVRPKNASIVYKSCYQWQDDGWMERRKREDHLCRPMNVYELHLGSWKRELGHFNRYRKLAHEVADYVVKMGYTHIELLPIMEHPLDDSWGYQVSGYFAPTSRFGEPDDLKYFVDVMHSHGIGVILDWVASHFLKDIDYLAHFDGTALYEHLDPRRGYQPQWDTFLFNYDRAEVQSFLRSSALLFCREFHFDGLRVDAVSSMLYLDFGRRDGEWMTNSRGGREHLEAIEFLRGLNKMIHEKEPGVITIAEEATAFPGVTAPPERGGLGFDLKWMMGWMHDTLRYLKRPPCQRKWYHQEMTFSMIYFYDERFLLPLSHDEVVHLKCSMFGKMPGDEWQKFASLRLLYSFAIAFPGKKLFFMGIEVGQRGEWNPHDTLPWYLLSLPFHKELQQMVAKINHLYKESSPLWELDFDRDGFAWVDIADHERSVISYFRKNKAGDHLFCIHHFGDLPQGGYRLNFPNRGKLTLLFSSDSQEFGGSNLEPKEQIIQEGMGPLFLQLDLPPLATLIYEYKPIS